MAKTLICQKPQKRIAATFGKRNLTLLTPTIVQGSSSNGDEHHATLLSCQQTTTLVRRFHHRVPLMQLVWNSLYLERFLTWVSQGYGLKCMFIPGLRKVLWTLLSGKLLSCNTNYCKSYLKLKRPNAQYLTSCNRLSANKRVSRITLDFMAEISKTFKTTDASNLVAVKVFQRQDWARVDPLGNYAESRGY